MPNKVPFGLRPVIKDEWSKIGEDQLSCIENEISFINNFLENLENGLVESNLYYKATKHYAIRCIDLLINMREQLKQSLIDLEKNDDKG